MSTMCPGFRLIETQKTALLIFSFLKVRGDPGQLTLLLTRGAGSGVLGDVDSFGVSEVELRDELLLESSLFCLLFPNGRREDTKSDASFCSSLCKSCFSLYARALAITWDKGMPNDCGLNSVRKKNPDIYIQEKPKQKRMLIHITSIKADIVKLLIP